MTAEADEQAAKRRGERQVLDQFPVVCGEQFLRVAMLAYGKEPTVTNDRKGRNSVEAIQ